MCPLYLKETENIERLSIYYMSICTINMELTTSLGGYHKLEYKSQQEIWDGIIKHKNQKDNDNLNVYGLRG